MGCYEKTKIKRATLLFPRHAHTNEKSPSEINDQMFPIQAQHYFINQSLRKKSREKERGKYCTRIWWEGKGYIHRGLMATYPYNLRMHYDFYPECKPRKYLYGDQVSHWFLSSLGNNIGGVVVF